MAQTVKEKETAAVVQGEHQNSTAIETPIKAVLEANYDAAKGPDMKVLHGKVKTFYEAFEKQFPTCDSGKCDKMILVSSKRRVRYKASGKTAHKKIRDAVKAINAALNTLGTSAAVEFFTHSDELSQNLRAAAPAKKRRKSTSAGGKKGKGKGKGKAASTKKTTTKKTTTKKKS